MKFHSITSSTFLFLFLLYSISNASGQVINVGNGSYTKNFPGVDAAGRNSFPQGMPLTIGKAASKPVPTNDWWSHKVKNNHSDNLFNYPFTLKTVSSGLVVTYIPRGPIDDILPVIVGVEGLNAGKVNVSDFTDWTVTMDWQNSTQHFQTTTGIGMPFLYFLKDDLNRAQVTVNQGTVTIVKEMMIVQNARNGADFAVYAPAGSEWIQNGKTYTSSLNGKNYWSMAFIPLDAANINTVANEYKKYAYVFPTGSKADWSYNASTSVVTTDFKVTTEIKEGSDSTMLLGLLPHQWANLDANSPLPDKYSYSTIRGKLKTLDGNTFRVENKFYGILPTLPYLDFYSSGFSPIKLKEKVALLENYPLNTWTDSYNEGQEMNKIIQTGRIAELSGDTVALRKILNTVKIRLENWLKASPNEVAFLFYYNQTWSALIGYPAGHGQDGNLNDHHFHWGYFIHAASFVEQFDPGWANKWGQMINLLVRDAASVDRDDKLFPYLRNFSPYAGHCWANGFASFPQGNDQESTSESMQFNSSLIHWGSVTGNDSIRDLGIYLYTTEQSAIEEYWFDMNDRNFLPNQQYSLVSRVWGNSYDNGTFWTNDIAASYGIELYPIHGGSLYLGQNTNYVRQLWEEIEKNTGILTNDPNANLWHDIMWEYLAFIDPVKAIQLYDSYPERALKFGVSDAQTYHWLHSMNVLGKVDISLTANHPLAAAFKKNGSIIYVAQNYSEDSIHVVFSNGFILPVAPKKLVTSLDITIKGVLTSSFAEAYPGGSVDLTVSIVNEEVPTKVEFYDGEVMINQKTQAPYIITADKLTIGKHNFYAKIYKGENFSITKIVIVTVGQQVPFSGMPFNIPGSFDAAHYDIYEGGTGIDIAYQDVSVINEGDFRIKEYVDAKSHSTEGDYIGWITPGEWVEYTVNVEKSGNYTMEFRYASGNPAGGGPMRFESDGIVVKSDITVNNTGNWNTWATKTVTNVPLKSGQQILRIFFENGEFNLGKLTFTYSSPLNYYQPIADAGPNQIIILPQSTTLLDGRGSNNPGGGDLSYTWSQVYGPSKVLISDTGSPMPEISSLVEGIFLFRLKVDNGSYSDEDEVFIISGKSANVPPLVSIISPVDKSQYVEEEVINVSISASDINDSITKVDLYANNNKIGTITNAPYLYNWSAATGNYSLTAIAFDMNGDSTISNVVNVLIVPAPSCTGTAVSGDFKYVFTEDDDNPSITFVPLKTGLGTPTCILYYGTDPSSLPGYITKPNVPFKINAKKGDKIYFYYTYSFPGVGEVNNSNHKLNYIIGTCNTITGLTEFVEMNLNYFPNPITNVLNIELPDGENAIHIYTLTGRLISTFFVSEPLAAFDMSSYPSGMYLITVVNDKRKAVFKVIK